MARWLIFIVALLALAVPASNSSRAQSCEQICQTYINYARGAGAPGTEGTLYSLYQQCISCQQGGGMPPYQAPSQCPAGYYVYGSYCIPNSENVCPGTGGLRSCPADQQCTSGGCIPGNATDCGTGAYCTDGGICWTDPADVPGFEPGVNRCLSAEQYSDYSRRVEEYWEEQQAKTEAERAEEGRRSRERREQTRREGLRGERREAEGARGELDQRTDGQVRRLTSDDAAARRGEGDQSAESIMRELRRNSILNRLNGTGNRQVASPQQRGNGAFPSRQSPAPVVTLPADRETALLPVPQANVETGPSGAGSQPSVVQDWLQGRPTNPENISGAARRAAEENRRRAEYEAERERIERETRRSEEEAYWQSLPDMSAGDELLRRMQQEREPTFSEWSLCVVGSQTRESFFRRCYSTQSGASSGNAWVKKYRICDVVRRCRVRIDDGSRQYGGPESTQCDGKEWICP